MPESGCLVARREPIREANQSSRTHQRPLNPIFAPVHLNWKEAKTYEDTRQIFRRHSSSAGRNNHDVDLH